MKKYVNEGCVVPWGYAYAWYDYAQRRAVCYPVGIHIIIALARWAYWRLALCVRNVETGTDAAARAKAARAVTAIYVCDCCTKVYDTPMPQGCTTYRCYNSQYERCPGTVQRYVQEAE